LRSATLLNTLAGANTQPNLILCGSWKINTSSLLFVNRKSSQLAAYWMNYPFGNENFWAYLSILIISALVQRWISAEMDLNIGFGDIQTHERGHVLYEMMLFG